MDNTEDFFKNYRGRYSQYWVERWGLIPELPTSFDNANSVYELVAWLQRAFKNLLDDFQQLESEFEDFKNALIDLLKYLIPELIRRYSDSAEFRALFITLLEDILAGEERTWVKDLLKELIEVDMRKWIETYLKGLLTDLELQEFFEKLFKVLLSDLQNQVNTNKTSIATASSRIDNLIANSGNGTIPTELVDMRVAYNGLTYSTAGQALRTASRLSNETFTPLINYFSEASLMTTVSGNLYGYTISSQTPTIYTTGGGGNSHKIYDVSLIDFIKITMTTASSGSIYNVIFTNADNNILASEKNTTTLSSYVKIFTVPVGAKNLIVSHKNGSAYPDKVETLTINDDKFLELSSINIDKILRSNIPEYYKSHLESKIPQIHTLEEEIGASGDVIGFITDIHQPSNSMHSPALLGEIKKRTNVKLLVDGGDNAYGSSSVVNTLSKCKEEIRVVTESFTKNFGTGILKIVGNHDNNGYGATYQGQELLPKQAEYSLMMKAQENVCVFNENDKTGMYSYFDNVEQKIRYALLSTEEIDVVRHGFSVNQTSWLINTALKFPSAGWSVAVFTHQPISKSGSFRFIRNVLTALNTGTTYSYHDTEIAGAEYHFECDFTGDKQANVLFCANGHIHKDQMQIVGGIVYFTTTCDAHYNDDYANLGYTRDVGTIAEQAFDIVAINKDIKRVNLVRVGAGSNRSFVYGSAPQIL